MGLNLRNRSGKTPLFHATELGHLEIVKLLLETDGVELDSKGYKGRMPLYWAAMGGHVEVVKLLLEKDGLMRTQPTRLATRRQ